jgi:hypothetical protein
MGHSFRTYLAGETLLTCRSCNNHLAVGESILSKVSVVFYHDRSLCGNWGWRDTRSHDKGKGGSMVHYGGMRYSAEPSRPHYGCPSLPSYCVFAITRLRRQHGLVATKSCFGALLTLLAIYGSTRKSSPHTTCVSHHI